jgi:Flp pilus assembly protein TadG
MERQPSNNAVALANQWRCHPLVDARGSQIVELAVTLPLLVVFAVGIFDFGNAFGVKLKVANAAREGARIASLQPSSDLSNIPNSGCQAPASICAVRDAVTHYLKAAKLSDCGLSTANSPGPPGGPSGLAWTFTSTGTCNGTLTLVIDRGAIYTASLGTPYSSTLTVEATSVQLQYPYNWQFNSVVVLLVPGASYSSSSLLTSTAVMQNLNN